MKVPLVSLAIRKVGPVLAALALILVALALVACGGRTATAPAPVQPGMLATLPAVQPDAPAPRPTATRPAAKPNAPAPTPTRALPTSPPPGGRDGLATIRLNDLPREAQRTVALIDKGGPFPYSRDGIVFENRERILPAKPSGYYHEYTVETPGSSDRGARRIVTGQDGTMYYTDDHYDSFKRIVR